MNLLNDWVPESLLYAMGWTLVHSLWQLVIISAALWLLMKVVRKSSPAFKYKLGLGALSLALITAFGTFIYEVSNFAPTPLLERLTLASATPQVFQASTSIGLESLIAMIISWIELQLPLLVNVWFVGALLFLFRLFNSLSEVKTLRKSSSEPNDFELEKKLYRLMGKMNISKKVEIRLTSYGLSPITFGYFKPIILIPAGLIFQLSPTQLEAIIAHELAHVKRNDYLENIFQSSLEVLFFYHPCYWWMNQTVKELRENAADDLAVKAGIAPQELAYSLAEVLNFAKQNPPELALAAAKKRNPTLQRIKRILGHPAQTYPQNPIISIPMLLTLLLSAGLMATAQQDVSAPVEKGKPIATLPVNAEANAVAQLVQSPKTVVAVDPIVDQVVSTVNVVEENSVWVNSNNEVIEIEAAKPAVFHVKGDTIITKGDTVIVKNSKKSSYVYKHNGKTVVLEDMPELELAPMPPFPAEAMAPAMDFAMAPTPVMEFEMAPVPSFDMDSMPVMAFEFAGSPMVFDFEGGTVFEFQSQDTIGMTKAEKEKWTIEMKTRANEMAMKAEEWAAEWEKNNAGFEEKMKAWQKEMEPKMKEFEKKMEAWQKSQEPKMKEFEAKMQAWQESNEPRMKEYEAKMKAWEKEMKPKLEEYERKMEVWQKENASKIEEYQKKLEEAFKKKDDNK
ncbi:M56 family metallopeptidase [Algoriphagus chordae]|uniref:Beta-lactamase regulating signal transducer with metallopeptidase domain n=1 Tax=Algoriphagus chordae TaxID=237019 RepID=A0A2W7QY68_9BACT|nr:M56 family metallopeptidase [Algoriphagus chordae]PZX53224.1 beta-lactamase regulating signal transducer with metallopeptidase domain [Algoriphagus chordae]